MTELLQQAIESLRSLPDERQDLLAHRILARIEEEQRKEASLLADLDAGLRELDAGKSSPWNRDDFLQEVARRGGQ